MSNDKEFFDLLSEIDEEAGRWQVKLASETLADWEERALEPFTVPKEAAKSAPKKLERRWAEDHPVATGAGITLIPAFLGGVAGRALAGRAGGEAGERAAGRLGWLLGAAGGMAAGGITANKSKERLMAAGLTREKLNKMKAGVTAKDPMAYSVVPGLLGTLGSGIGSGISLSAARKALEKAKMLNKKASEPGAVADSLQFDSAVGSTLNELKKDKKKLLSDTVESADDKRLSNETPSDSKVEPEQVREVSEAKTAMLSIFKEAGKKKGKGINYEMNKSLSEMSPAQQQMMAKGVLGASLGTGVGLPTGAVLMNMAEKSKNKYLRAAGMAGGALAGGAIAGGGTWAGMAGGHLYGKKTKKELKGTDEFRKKYGLKKNK